MITRRCIFRELRLRPSRAVEQLILYLLAVGSSRFSFPLHAFDFMSNHYHLIATDRLGNVPEFAHWFNGLVARALNCYYGRWESFWAPGSYSAVELVDIEDIIEKCAYVLANPVEAELVPCGAAWPGVISHPNDWREDADGSRVTVVERPKWFFSDRSELPEWAELRITCPPALAKLPREQVIANLIARRKEKENAAAQRMHAEGRRFLGAKRVLAQSPFARPSSREPRRELSPVIACRCRWRRIEELQCLKSFRLRYRDALERFREGERTVLFPYGTWGPARLYGAEVEPCPGPEETGPPIAA
jgi:hypothetical protein